MIFYHLDKLGEGDEVLLKDRNDGRYEYRRSKRWWWTSQTPGDEAPEGSGFAHTAELHANLQPRQAPHREAERA